MNLLLTPFLTRYPIHQGAAATDTYGDVVRGVSGRVSWWRFGEGPGASTAIDEEGTQNGSYQGEPILAQTPLQADTGNTDITLSGADFIEATHNAAYLLANGTAVVWFRATDLSANRTLLSKDASGIASGDMIFWYVQSTDQLRFQLEDATQLYGANAAGALMANVTYCAAIQWGSGGMRVYLASSGGPLVLVASNSFTGGLGSNTRNLRIGATQWRGAAGDHFVGRLGDVVIWNRALSTSELEAVAQAGASGGEGDYEIAVSGLTPAIYLKLNEASGASFADSSGNGRSGALTGTVGGYNVTTLPGATAAGNGGVNLGGAASISIPHATADAALTWPSNWESERSVNGYRFVAQTAVSVWFKLNALPTGANKAVIVAKANAETPGTALSYTSTHPITATSTITGGSFEAYVDANGAVHVEVRSFRGRPCRIRTPNGAVSATTTYHLVVELGYTGVTAWLNGAQLEDGIPNAQHVFGLCCNIRRIIHLNNFDWMIGKAAWGGQADIQVDEFAVYHRAYGSTLSQANINTLARQGSTPAALAHHIWGQRFVNRSSFANIQAAVDNVASLGGGTVLINAGSYTENVQIKNNVRLKRNGSSGTVTINGVITTATPSIQNLGVGTGNLAIGDRTINISNSRSVGDHIVVRGITNGVGGAATALRHNRRWSQLGEGESDDLSDGEMFICESRTGSAITFEGNGISYAISLAQRQEVLAFTPTRWWALENLRIVAPNGTGSSVRAVQALYSSHVRIVDCDLTTDVQSAIDAGWYTIDLNGIRPRMTRLFNSGVVGGGTPLSVRNGSKDCVFVDAVAVNQARAFFDCLSTAAYVPTMRGEIHGCVDETPLVTPVAKFEAKYGAHDTIADCLYWRLHSKFGGLSVQGWKSDVNFANLGDPEGKAPMGVDAGFGDCCFRNVRFVAPTNWFVASSGVEGSHFENFRRTAAPTGSSHTVRYGTGSRVNTYTTGTVDGTHASWTAV